MCALKRNHLGLRSLRPFFMKKSYDLSDPREQRKLTEIGINLRSAFEELGPTFVKIGQFLSTHTDVVSEPIAKQLEDLQDSVPPFSYEEAREVIKQDFGEDVSRLFARFDKMPIASASISQVYRARLYSGADVAVKIQRPNIKETVEVDLHIIERLVTLLTKYTHAGDNYDLTGMVAEFRAAMERELNFLEEGENLEYFRQSVKDQPNVKVPKVKWVYTTNNVLTMEYVDGVKISEKNRLIAQGSDPSGIAHTFIESLLTQILQNGIFHADPHPGNVFVVDKVYVEFIDLGLVGSIGKGFRRQLSELVYGIATRNTLQIAHTISEMDTANAAFNTANFQKSVSKLLDNYLYVPLAQVKLADLFASVMELAAQYNMKVPGELTLVGKCLSTAQGTVELLDPSLNILKIAERIIKGMLFSSIRSGDFENEVFAGAQDVWDIAKNAPSFIRALMQKLKKNDFALELKMKDIGNLEKSMNRMVNRISFAIILLSVCIVMAGVVIGVSYTSIASHDQTIFGLGSAALAGGLVIGLIIVVGLIISMLRSRNR